MKPRVKTVAHHHHSLTDTVACQQWGCRWTILVLLHTHPEIKQWSSMNGKSWEPGLSLLEWKATHPQEKEPRRTHDATCRSWRHQHKVMCNSTQTGELHMETVTDVHTRVSAHTCISISVIWEGLEAHLVPGSWLIFSFEGLISNSSFQ